MWSILRSSTNFVRQGLEEIGVVHRNEVWYNGRSPDLVLEDDGKQR